jgi:hypothetical protein
MSAPARSAQAGWDAAVELLAQAGIDPAAPGGFLELFARKRHPGWTDPEPLLLDDRLPGIFVEPAGAEDTCAALSEPERLHVATLVLLLRCASAPGGRCSWTRIGYGAGREYGHVNVRADCRDGMSVLSVGSWALVPAAGCKPWAVEYPARFWTGRETGPFSADYQRRTFWFPRLHKVGDEAFRVAFHRERDQERQRYLERAAPRRRQQLAADRVGGLLDYEAAP